MISKSQSTFIFCLAYITGTYLAPNFAVPTKLLFSIIIMLLLLSWIVNNKLFYFFLIIFSLIISKNHFQNYLQKITNHNIQTIVGQYFQITGIIEQPPIISNNQQKINLNQIRSQSQNFSGQALVIAPISPKYSYGQVLELNGMIEKPKNNDQTSFSYTGYLAKNYTFVQLYYPKIKVTGKQPNFIYQYLYNIKDNISSRLHQNLTPINSSFLAGILLGEKNSLPIEIYEQFRQLGLTHIIVVSGFNLTIFANFFIKYLRGIISRRLAFFITITCIISFTIMTGADSSIVRALIMSTIAIISPFLSRQNNPLTAILVAATIMVYLNPLILWYDLGFHLSFLATFGLIFFTSNIEKIIDFIPIIKRFSGGLCESLAAQISTSPYIIYLFHSYSLLSLPANAIIVPLVPLLMFYGLITIFSSLILPEFLRLIVNLPLNLSLYFILKLIEFLSQLKFFNFSFTPHKKIIIAYYFILIIYVFFQSQKSKIIPGRQKT